MARGYVRHFEATTIVTIMAPGRMTADRGAGHFSAWPWV